MAAGFFQAEMSMLSSTLARYAIPFREKLMTFDFRIAMEQNQFIRMRRSRVAAFSSSPSHSRNFPIPGKIFDIQLPKTNFRKKMSSHGASGT